MNNSILILVASASFTIIGLCAAWGAAAYSFPPQSTYESNIPLFVLFPLFGLATGLGVGWLAIVQGRRFSRER